MADGSKGKPVVPAEAEAPKEPTLRERIEEMVKAGRITIHTQEVRADKKETLLGSAPVYHAVDGDLEALSLIHERVGGATYVTRTVNADFNSTVSTSVRNYVRHPKEPVKIDVALKDKLGLEGDAFYSKLRYGSFQEVDSVLRECNKRLKEIDDELKECKATGNREGAKALFKEQSDVERTKSERNFDIQFGAIEG